MPFFQYIERADKRFIEIAVEKLIETAVKKERSKQLHALAQSMRQKLLTRQIGSSHTVLWETKNEDGIVPKWKGSQPYKKLKPTNLNSLPITKLFKIPNEVIFF